MAMASPRHRVVVVHRLGKVLSQARSRVAENAIRVLGLGYDRDAADRDVGAALVLVGHRRVIDRPAGGGTGAWRDSSPAVLERARSFAGRPRAAAVDHVGPGLVARARLR